MPVELRSSFGGTEAERPSRDSMHCPVCVSESTNLTPPTYEGLVIGCPRCGKYRIMRAALADLRSANRGSKNSTSVCEILCVEILAEGLSLSDPGYNAVWAAKVVREMKRD
jgi:predicted RNA-binding Zn-ribbon protein involved in translation (DUF1610 family)